MRRPPQCQQCKRFIGRPSNTCGYCGHSPLPHNCDARDIFEFDRAHGYER